MRGALALWLALVAAGALSLDVEDRTAREARALLVAQSVVRDGDLDVADDLGAAEFRDLGVDELAPEGDGHFEPLGIGFPLLLAPAFAVGGVLAVQLWLLALWAAGWVAARGLARLLAPEPWATWGTLALALSAPSLLAATRVAPEGAVGALLAGGAALALRTRERPRTRTAASAGALAALAPWLAARSAMAAGVVALAAVRWPRRRRRGLAALLAAEAAILSAVVLVAVNERLFGGPLAAGPQPAPARLLDLLTAPVLLLAILGGWAAWRAARALGTVVRDEVTGVALCLAASVAVLAGSALSLAGEPAVALPLLAPLVALGWRRAPRWAVAVLLAATAALGAAALALPRL